METFARRLVLLGAAAAAVPLLAALPVGTAEAAAKTVTIGSSAFSPSTLTIAPKDSVAFKNGTGTVVSLSYSSNWPGSPNPETLTPGATSTRRTLTAVGTYTATATGVGVSSSGKVVVKKPAATSTPTPKPSTSPPTTPRATPTATGSASTQPTPSAGTVTTPPISSTPSATPQPTVTSSALPSIAPPPTADPPVLAGGSKRALLQPHPVRRLGLPGALSAVLVLGLLFALGRVLLAMAPPRGQRG